MGNVFLIKDAFLAIVSTLNNRELALGIWLIICIVLVLASKKIRGSVLNLIKIAFCAKFVAVYFTMLIYLMTTIYILYLAGLWDLSLLKDTIIWFFFTGVVSGFKGIEAKDFHYFKARIKDYIKATLVIEFIIHSYPFSLFGELLLLPTITTLLIFMTFLDNSPEFQVEKYTIVKKMFRFLNLALSIYIIFSAMSAAFWDLNNLRSANSIKSLVLPPILSVTFLGYIYFFALFCKYEEIFVRISFGEKKSKSLIAYIKIRIIAQCHINLNKVSNFWRPNALNILNIKNKEEAVAFFKSIDKKNHLTM